MHSFHPSISLIETSLFAPEYFYFFPSPLKALIGIGFEYVQVNCSVAVACPIAYISRPVTSSRSEAMAPPCTAFGIFFYAKWSPSNHFPNHDERRATSFWTQDKNKSTISSFSPSFAPHMKSSVNTNFSPNLPFLSSLPHTSSHQREAPRDCPSRSPRGKV